MSRGQSWPTNHQQPHRSSRSLRPLASSTPTFLRPSNQNSVARPLRARSLVCLTAACSRRRAQPACIAPSPVLSGALALTARAEDWRRSAAAWLDSAGHLDLAMDCHEMLGADSVRDFVRARGPELIKAGRAPQVAQALHEVGTNSEFELDTLLGQARQAAGDWDGAVTAFRAAARHAPGGRLPANMAWRFALLLYLYGDTDSGLTTLVDALEPTTAADDALVSGWRASLLWSMGDLDQARLWSQRALEAAARSGDPTATAAAHTSAALVAASSGDMEANLRHYGAALVAAEDAGDSVQLARIRANLSSRALQEGNARAAVAEADAALAVGRGHSVLAGLALGNKADSLLRLGLLDEARAAATEALDSFGHTSSTMTGDCHLTIATIDRERGDLVKARLGYERSIRLSDSLGDVHTATFSRARLARTIAADNPPAAREIARRAMDQATDLERSMAFGCGRSRRADRPPAGRGDRVRPRRGSRGA